MARSQHGLTAVTSNGLQLTVKKMSLQNGWQACGLPAE
ncbi:MAG: hypothetical protein RIQ71_1353 [Verrucomicrobiota bacterium]